MNYSNEAEQAILGILLLEPDVYDDVSDLTPDSFYNQTHSEIYAEIQKIIDAGQTPDFVSVSSAMASRPHFDDIGGVEYLAKIAEAAAGLTNHVEYAAIIDDRHRKRQLESLAYQLQAKAVGVESADDVEAFADDAIQGLLHKDAGEGAADLSALLKESLRQLDERFNSESELTGLSTGIKALDDMTGGLNKSDLIILAARPAMGKSSLAMNFVEQACIRDGVPTVVFSQEMPAGQLLNRMYASLGGIEQGRIKSGKMQQDDWTRLAAAVNLINGKPLAIDDRASRTPSDIRKECRRVKRQFGGLGLIVVDYLQLMKIKGFKEGRVGEITAISMSLKAIAKEFDCPVIALSQLNRSLENRPNKRPINSDLRESGAIEQDADVIAFIYRDEVYNEDTPEKGVAEIILGKQRNGPIGTAFVEFQGKYARFTSLTKDYN